MNDSRPLNGTPDVILRGGPEERGALHGSELLEKIEGVVDFYGDYIGMREAEVFVAARHFKSVIQEFSVDYVLEIEALADAAQINPLWIYAVNSRSEITELGQNECTALFFPRTGLLAQNWDWFAQIENLMVIIRIELPEKHSILMMTEPGIIGKIGLNSAGLGVCLNFLTDPRTRRGLPIHILMRALLEANSLLDIKQDIERAGVGRSGNLLIGAAGGNGIDIEFRTDCSYEFPVDNNIFLHTNHYLGCDLATGTLEQQENTLQRLSHARRLATSVREQSFEELNDILSDCSDSDHPICAPYRERDGIGILGTICTLIMDLPTRTMHLRKGSDPSRGYQIYPI